MSYLVSLFYDCFVLLSGKIQFRSYVFPFLATIPVFLCGISLISRFKCPLSCFLPIYFLFIVLLLVLILLVLFLIAVISLPPGFCMWSLSRRIDALKLSSILGRPLPPSFIVIYSLSSSCLGCNALCMVISFLVLWSIRLSSSLFYFKNGPSISRVEITQVSISLIRCLVYSFVSNSFLIMLKYSFIVFSFISSYFLVSASSIPKYLWVSFPPSLLILSWFGIPSVRCRFPLFIKAHFSTPNSILTVIIRISKYFSFFGTQFDVIQVL